MRARHYLTHGGKKMTARTSDVAEQVAPEHGGDLLGDGARVHVQDSDDSEHERR